MNGTTPSSNVLTASIEVLYVSIAKDLNLDTKFSILAFSRVFYPICQFKLVLRLEKDSQTEQDEIINSRFSSDLLLLASDTYPPIDANTVKFSARSSEGDKYCLS